MLQPQDLAETDLPYTFSDADSDLKLRVKVSDATAGYKLVKVRNTNSSPCDYKLLYHLDKDPEERVEMQYTNGRPYGGSGMCYPPPTL